MLSSEPALDWVLFVYIVEQQAFRGVEFCGQDLPVATRYSVKSHSIGIAGSQTLNPSEAFFRDFFSKLLLEAFVSGVSKRSEATTYFTKIYLFFIEF